MSGLVVLGCAGCGREFPARPDNSNWIPPRQCEKCGAPIVDVGFRMAHRMQAATLQLQERMIEIERKLGVDLAGDIEHDRACYAGGPKE